jgi:hypothetical protein
VTVERTNAAQLQVDGEECRYVELDGAYPGRKALVAPSSRQNVAPHQPIRTLPIQASSVNLINSPQSHHHIASHNLQLPDDDNMASLRTRSAAGLLRSVSSTRVASPHVTRRFQSSVTQATGTVPAPVENQPDYDVPGDKATSYVPAPLQFCSCGY